MPIYRFVAKGYDGKNVRGTMEADSESRVQQILKASGQFLLLIRETAPPMRSLGKTATLKDLSIFCRQFHVMLRSGVTVVKCLDLLYQQTNKRRFKDSILKLYETVQRGDLLSSALAKQPDVYPELMISMVDTGEVSGTLDVILGKLAIGFEKDVRIQRKVRSSMTYPIVLTILSILVVIFLLTFVLPMFVNMFKSSGVLLPLPTRMLLALSGFLTKNWGLLLIVLIGSIIGLKAYVSTEPGRLQWDTLKLALPIVGPTLDKIYAMRLTRTLSTLVTAGLPLLSAMDIANRVIGNRRVSKHLVQAKSDIQSGVPLSTALRKTGVFPLMVHAMIGIGEESGSLDGMLETTADYFEEETDKSLQTLVTLLEPLLILMMAGMVGFIAISILMPIFEMSRTIR